MKASGLSLYRILALCLSLERPGGHRVLFPTCETAGQRRYALIKDEYIDRLQPAGENDQKSVSAR
jgi:hypothetical protein